MKSDTEPRSPALLWSAAAAMAVTLLTLSGPAQADVREEVLRKAAISHGVPDRFPLAARQDPGEVALGRMLFEDQTLSLNGGIACRDCHLDVFSSADGLPNAIGVGGKGQGTARLESGGQIVPRNTLPLWARGAPGFTVFFWDGKVEATAEGIISQFGDAAPSSDPLVVAAHLPTVEIREMVSDDVQVEELYEKEDVGAATALQERITARIRATPEYARRFAEVRGLEPEAITYLHVAEALAAFIRADFRVEDLRFNAFLRGEERLSGEEIAGGLVFFGKGRCALCHNGPFFSDLAFHAVPFPQAGFGKNGFGIDQGRFNVTHAPADMFRFRTPPLINVTETAPYGHSGFTYSLRDAIVAHSDPLALIDPTEMSPLARHDLYRRLLASAPDADALGFLEADDIDALVSFLRTLTPLPRNPE